MSSARATTIAQGFSQRLMKEVYDISMIDKIVNRDYEGEINKVGSQLNIYNLDRITERDYVKKNNGTPDDLFENNSLLIIEKKKMFYWGEYTIDNWLSYIKDPHSTVVGQKADERSRNMDLYALGFYKKVAAGNRVGTDVTDVTSGQTVAIDASGNVTASGGSPFTSAMVGRGFKATGHTKYYRVKTFTDSTHIIIENDLDDVASAYDGGVINAGAGFVVEAVTAVQITTSNLLTKIAALKLRLNIAERQGKSSVPDADRFLIVPPEFEDVVVNAAGIALHVPDVYQELVKVGFITMLQGFKVFKSNRLTGDNTNGFHVIAGHSNWLTFAEKVLQADIEEEVKGDFGTAYKDLFVYGGKVTDKRRHFAAEGLFTFNV